MKGPFYKGISYCENKVKQKEDPNKPWRAYGPCLHSKEINDVSFYTMLPVGEIVSRVISDEHQKRNTYDERNK